MPLFNRAALIGVGLIGGSLALDAKKAGLIGSVAAASRRTETLETAKRRGIADFTTLDVVECVRGADLVVLASPVSAMPGIIKSIADKLDGGAILTDVGSVKGFLVELIEQSVLDPSRYVPGHPIAGSEKFGPEAAVEGLFKGKKFILTPTKNTNRDAALKIRKLWEGIGMNVVEMDPFRHDAVLAVTSHLPHLVAYALVNTLMKEKENEPDILDFTAGGFHDFTRIAASSPEMWRDIFLANRSNLIQVLKKFKAAINEIEDLIGRNDAEELWSKLDAVRKFRK